MALELNTNIPSLAARRFLNDNQTKLQQPLQKLGSGLRINGAKDDPAGLAIATRIVAQIEGGNQAIRNANDGISVAQVAEGGIQQMQDNLQRMRELAVQSSNGMYSAADRAAMQEEFSALQQDIGRVSEATQFNGTQVLATQDTLFFQVGADAGEQVAVETTDMMDAETGIGDVLDSGATSIATQDGAGDAIVAIDAAIDRASEVRSRYGSAQTAFDSTISNLGVSTLRQESAKSRVLDADYAKQSAELARLKILNESGVAMLGQANAMPQFALRLLGS